MNILGVLLLVLAVIQLGIGVAAWSGKLPGNNIIGIRIPEARASEEMWVLTHRIAGPLWTLGALSLGFGGLLAFVVSGYWWLLVMLAVVGWLVLMGMGAGMAANAAALIDASNKDEGGCCSSGGGEDSAEGGCCTPAANDADSSSCADEDPSKDCGVSGGCGSCALNGSCEGGGDAFNANAGVNLDGVRKAANTTDKNS
ncbi:SdpI family protein [Corynebacterium aquilae]|uniref:SdpI/YhfL protein family n=1 Tax=Corynebacterium aquilae DSM 44791 TaxID=1431546 RepID=A0A1L7CIN5_9CORY|nr:SdpI family protein [Corynebacterium aquilae]APT85727.1 hypothetical protein CAQU_12555 [Corynebacterium aquilae DSM 44791]